MLYKPKFRVRGSFKKLIHELMTEVTRSLGDKSNFVIYSKMYFLHQQMGRTMRFPSR